MSRINKKLKGGNATLMPSEYYGGNSGRFSDNALVILSGSGSPLSSRIYGTVDQSIRLKTLNLKIISLARVLS